MESEWKKSTFCRASWVQRNEEKTATLCFYCRDRTESVWLINTWWSDLRCRCLCVIVLGSYILQQKNHIWYILLLKDWWSWIIDHSRGLPTYIYLYCIYGIYIGCISWGGTRLWRMKDLSDNPCFLCCPLSPLCLLTNHLLLYSLLPMWTNKTTYSVYRIYFRITLNKWTHYALCNYASEKKHFTKYTNRYSITG